MGASPRPEGRRTGPKDCARSPAAGRPHARCACKPIADAGTAAFSLEGAVEGFEGPCSHMRDAPAYPTADAVHLLQELTLPMHGGWTAQAQSKPCCTVPSRIRAPAWCLQSWAFRIMRASAHGVEAMQRPEARAAHQMRVMAGQSGHSIQNLRLPKASCKDNVQHRSECGVHTAFRFVAPNQRGGCNTCRRRLHMQRR